MKNILLFVMLFMLTACAQKVPRVKNDQLVRAELLMPEGKLTNFTVTAEFGDFNIQSNEDLETVDEYGFIKISYVQKHFVAGDGAFLNLSMISGDKDVKLHIKKDEAYYQINQGKKIPLDKFNPATSFLVPSNNKQFYHYIVITDAGNRKRVKIKDGDIYHVHIPFVFNEHDFVFNVSTKLKIVRIKAVRHVPGTP